MQFYEVVVLGIVQGLTEFLPVSSSGHLWLARHLLKISDVQGTAFDAFLHLGTLTAVLVYYWRVWWGIGRGLARQFGGQVRKDEEDADKVQLMAKLALATVPAAVVGYFGQSQSDLWFRSTVVVALGLGFTGFVLLIDLGRSRAGTVRRASFYDALLIGLAQVLALVPGVSRSGVTIAAGRARGLSRTQAVSFSFLLSAPIIAGAGLASLSTLVAAHTFAAETLLVGFAVSFVSGLAAISLLLKFIERISLVPFAVYLLILAAGLLVYV